MKTYGYIRVSTKEQKTDRQDIALQEAGVPKRMIFTDRLSGRNFDRPAYQQLIRKLKPGDTLFVKSIDRLGRNYDEIQEQWRITTKEHRCNIVVLDMPLLDTREEKDRTGVFIADLVLQILSYVAETEREFIRTRQEEGIAAAKERGVVFGRPPIKRPENYPEIYRRWNNGEISARRAAEALGVYYKTFLRWTEKDRQH